MASILTMLNQLLLRSTFFLTLNPRRGFPVDEFLPVIILDDDSTDSKVSSLQRRPASRGIKV